MPLGRGAGGTHAGPESWYTVGAAGVAQSGRAPAFQFAGAAPTIAGPRFHEEIRTRRCGFFVARYPAIHHAARTGRPREGHGAIDRIRPGESTGAMTAQLLPPVEEALDPSLPLRGFVRLYEAHLRSERKTPKTIEVYKYVLGKFETWFTSTYGQPPTLAHFSRDQVRLFLVAAQDRPKWQGHPTLDGVTAEGISGATVHHYVRTLKTFGSWLDREDYARTNPLATLRLPKVDQKELLPLTEAEERQLLDTYNDNNPNDCRSKAIFLLMLDTGLRLSEVIHLQDANLDLDNGFLLVMGKGRKERSVPFGFTTEKVLRKYVTFFRPDPATPNFDEFFLSPDGYPLTEQAMKMLFTRARKRTGITRLHAHLLRHTYGIRAQENDMPTITLQHYMGHSSSKVTERYVHAAQSEKLKRARGYSPVDRLRLRVKQVGQRGRATRRRR